MRICWSVRKSSPCLRRMRCLRDCWGGAERISPLRSKSGSGPGSRRILPFDEVTTTIEFLHSCPTPRLRPPLRPPLRPHLRPRLRSPPPDRWPHLWYPRDLFKSSFSAKQASVLCLPRGGVLYLAPLPRCRYTRLRSKNFTTGHYSDQVEDGSNGWGTHLGRLEAVCMSFHQLAFR